MIQNEKIKKIPNFDGDKNVLIFKLYSENVHYGCLKLKYVQDVSPYKPFLGDWSC